MLKMIKTMQIDNVIPRNVCIIGFNKMYQKILSTFLYRNLVIMMLMTTAMRHVRGII